MIRRFIAAIALAATLVIAPAAATIAPVSAGNSCYPPIKSRSGSWATYSAYGTGAGNHRVEVNRNGFWYYGPWVYGSGYSTITLYHPTYGTAICRVQ